MPLLNKRLAIGFQTAFQMLLAGLPLPEGTHDDEFPLTLQELRKMNGQRVFLSRNK